MKKLLVITPLRKEFQALADALKGSGLSASRRRIGKIATVTFHKAKIILALGGHGKIQFALHAQHLLERLPGIKLVVCAGVAGGLAKSLKVGDVVVAVQTVEHDYKERFDGLPAPRFPADPKALSALKRRPPAASGFRTHFGVVASGDEDIVSPERARKLRRETKALAVAWEGAGGARACRFHGRPYLEIRGITDSADEHAPGDFSTHLKLAMKNVAAILPALS